MPKKKDEQAKLIEILPGNLLSRVRPTFVGNTGNQMLNAMMGTLDDDVRAAAVGSMLAGLDNIELARMLNGMPVRSL